MSLRALLVATFLAATLGAGCLDDAAPEAASPDGCGNAPCASPPPGPRVVVGDIDSGINVYHDRFAGELDPALVASFVDAATGEPPEVVFLTRTGTYEERFEADEHIWDNLTRGRLYHFFGTRVLGISFLDDEIDENPVLDAPEGSHGTATAGAVLDANPEAILVMVEGGQGVGGPFGALAGADQGQGELWAMQQPWIDVTTMSYGPPGSPPTVALEEAGTHAATRIGWRAGKIPVGAADNTPSLAPNDQTAGPPWVIGVAGDHVETQCRDHASGTFPDVTANFTQVLPLADSVDGRRQTSGTSFSTPTTAGTLSAAILELRKHHGHAGGIVDGALVVATDGAGITNAVIRDALNATAYYFEPAVCQPDPSEIGPTSTPVNPVAPYLQMGWGHVGPEIVPALVARVLAGEGGVPADKAEAAAFQGALYDYRVQLWGEP